MAPSILNVPRTVKQIIALSVDACICVLATWLAFYLRLDEFIRINGELARPAILSIVIALPVFGVAGLYRVIFKYSGWPTIVEVGKAMTLYTLIYLTIVMAIGLDGTPRTIGVIQPLLLFFGVAGSRLLARYWLGGVYREQWQKDSQARSVIYGAGTAGNQLATALRTENEMRVIGFLDDEERLHGRVLNGLQIFAPDDLPNIIISKKVTHILLAMPSASRRRRNEILEYVSRYPVAVRTLPSMMELAEGRVTVDDVKDLDIDDLLGRDSVSPDRTLLFKKVSDKTVLVTGAGGSIGGELCRQILKLNPTKIVLVEVNEYALYTIYSELEAISDAPDKTSLYRIIPILASVQDEKRMRDILETWQPDTVYHAAAYKHVPLVEHNLVEGVKNNVLGTLKTAQLAIDTGVSDFVLISTDKAVRPTNVMGATKRLAEICLQALYAAAMEKSETTLEVKPAAGAESQRPKTRLCMVRFGNVLDSSGSVIPKFRKQIHGGGPVTLTHPEITRYFMTIPEAAQLVIQAGAMADGGDVFILDMGEPVRIADLAYRMVELSNLTVRDEKNPDGDIEIVITGLRPGEKLYEELLLGDDPLPTQHAKIQRAQDTFVPWSELEAHLNSLEVSLGQNNVGEALSLLRKLVTGYKPHSDIVDWGYQEQFRRGKRMSIAD